MNKQLKEELKRLEFYRKHEKKFFAQISITKQIIAEIRKQRASVYEEWPLQRNYTQLEYQQESKTKSN